ncbi:hypothetical protein EYF80_059163 [Liparis tanakae]|uniref:Uncharacterized protein n=1 Tax=Liparis tanakae TaxID=230148 RepID=A0A4Z2EQN6_9TELE|nr:hypothetical protein EYF80_059163 [Liparis tanakae]
MPSWCKPEPAWTLRSSGSSRVKVQLRSRWLRSLQWTLSSRRLSSSHHLLSRSPRSKLAFSVSRLARREIRCFHERTRRLQPQQTRALLHLSASLRKNRTCSWHSAGSELKGKWSSAAFRRLLAGVRVLFRGDMADDDELTLVVIGGGHRGSSSNRFLQRGEETAPFLQLVLR